MTPATTVTIFVSNPSDVLATGTLVAAQIVQVDPPFDARLLGAVEFDMERGGTFPVRIRLQSSPPAEPVDETIAADQVLVLDAKRPELPVYFALSKPSNCPPDDGGSGNPCTWFHHPKPFFC